MANLFQIKGSPLLWKPLCVLRCLFLSEKGTSPLTLYKICTATASLPRTHYGTEHKRICCSFPYRISIRLEDVFFNFKENVMLFCHNCCYYEQNDNDSGWQHLRKRLKKKKRLLSHKTYELKRNKLRDLHLGKNSL